MYRFAFRAILVGVVCLNLIGCSGGLFSPSPTATTDRLETLHLKGVTELVTVYELLDQMHVPEVRLIGSLLLPGQSAAELPYLAFSVGRDLYAVRPDGGDLHSIYKELPCYLPAFGMVFSPDGQWLACPDGRTNTIWIAQLPAKGSPTQWHRIEVTATDIGQTISWSPDGQQLIVTSLQAPCSTYIFQLSAAHDSAQLVKSLVFPTLSDKNVCNLTWAGWSPDGQYLALSHLESLKPTYYVVSLETLAAQGSKANGALAITVPAQSLIRVGTFADQPRYAAVWSSEADTLILNDHLRAIIEVRVSGEPPTTLLTVPISPLGAHLCTVGSIAKSHLIAFTYCFQQLPDQPRPIRGPGERLFVFNPLAS